MADHQWGQHGARVAVPRLSRLECDVLAVSSRGSSVTEIALELGVEKHQVRAALAAAMIALGARSRLDAVLTAAQQGLIQLSSHRDE